MIVMKAYGSGKWKLPFFALWMYLWVLLMLQAVALDVQMSWGFAGVLCVAGFGGTCVLLNAFARFVSHRKEPVEKDCPMRQSAKMKWGGVILAATFAIGVFYQQCWFADVMPPDIVDQYEQAVNGVYSDWHPVLHTLLFFTLPVKLGLDVTGMVILQLFYFGLAFAYLMLVLMDNGLAKKWALAMCMYVWLNPYLAGFLMVPLKDIAMMIFAMVLLAYTIQIIQSKGLWLKNGLHIVLFAVFATLATKVRHNAILFTGPLIATALFYGVREWKPRLKAIAAVVLCFLCVQAGYAALDVEKPGRRIVETVGLPATIWCNVIRENPAALDKETREMMYALANPGDYTQYYRCGEFNLIKWSGKYDLDLLDTLSYREVLEYTWRCFRYAPKESFQALAKLTRQVWGIDGADQAVIRSDSPVEKLILGTGIGRTLFGSYGLFMLVLVVTAAGLFAMGRSSWIHALPLLCYSFGTMLLLSGKDYRFFLLNLPLWGVTLFLMLLDQRKMPVRRSRTAETEH